MKPFTRTDSEAYEYREDSSVRLGEKNNGGEIAILYQFCNPCILDKLTQIRKLGDEPEIWCFFPYGNIFVTSLRS